MIAQCIIDPKESVRGLSPHTESAWCSSRKPRAVHQREVASCGIGMSAAAAPPPTVPTAWATTTLIRTEQVRAMLSNTCSTADPFDFSS